MMTPRPQPRFDLLRYFSLSSLVAFLLVVALFARFIEGHHVVFSAVLIIFTLFYALLLLIARHAQRSVERQSAELYRLSQAVEQNPDGVILTDLEGRIEYANARYVEMTGYTKEEMIGKPSRIFQSGITESPVYDELWKTVTVGRVWSGEFCNKRKDGSFYWEHATIAPLYDAEGRMTHFVATKEDITLRKLADDALRKSQERFRKVIEHDVDAIVVVDQERIVRFINPAARRLFDVQDDDMMVGKYFSIPAFNGESTEFEIPRCDGSASVVEIRSVEIEWEQQPAYLESLRDITEHKRVEEALLASQQKLSETYQREHQRRLLSDTLRKIAGIVGSTLDSEEVLRLMLDQLERVITYHRATVSTLEDETLFLMAGKDKRGDVIKPINYPAYKYPLNADVLRSKKPICLPDVSHDPRWHPSPTMRTIRSMIFAPLLVQRQPIGILAVSRVDEIPYEEEDARTVFAFANQVAIAMHNAQLYGRMQERNRRLALLHDVSQTLASTFEMSKFLTGACETLVRNFHADHSAVLLFDEAYTHGEIVTEFPSGHVRGQRFSLQEYGVAKEILATAKPVAVLDAQHDPRAEKIRDFVQTVGIQSLLVVPIISKGRIIGSFSLSLTQERREFERSEIEMAQTIASQMAVAIENARWIEKEHQRLEEELSIAWHIQNSLLPVGVPDIPGLDCAGFCYPASKVGGDFYNYFVFPHHELGVAVGDVAGKGIQAALMMALSVGLLTTKVQKDLSPSKLLATLNTDLQPHVRRNWMNTALTYAMLQPSVTFPGAWHLQIANAGLVPPLIRRQNRDTEWCDVGGLPLGISEKSVYSEKDMILYPGDMLILCSDGVTEAMSAEQGMYGNERFAQRVAALTERNAQQVLIALLDDVRGFAGNDDTGDDMTMVVVVVRS